MERKEMKLQREYTDLFSQQKIRKSTSIIFQKEKIYKNIHINVNNENDYYKKEYKKKEKEYEALKYDFIDINNKLDSLREVIKEKEEIIRSKDQQIILKEYQLTDKDDQIQHLNRQLIDKNNQIKVKDMQLNQFMKKLTIDSPINEKNTIIINNDPLIDHNENERKRYIDKYSEEEKDKRNKMIFSNQLILNQNLISYFGSYGTDPFTHFNYPHYLSFNVKLNITAVSDYDNNRIKIMDIKGTLVRCFPFQSPRGIAIIPSLSLLAVSSYTKHVVMLFDISPLIQNKKNQKNKDEVLPLLYTIGKPFGKGYAVEEGHFNHPEGIGYSEEKGILAISDCVNKRIEIYKIRRDGYELHSSISSLPFYPSQVAISSLADLILVSNQSKVLIYKAEAEEENEGREKKRRWREEGEIRPPPSLLPPLKNPRGIAIHSPLNYCIICDYDNNRILFFNLTTRDLICSYQPTVHPPLPRSSSSYYFQNVCGISVDEEADLFYVTDVGSHSISLILSPIV